MKLGGGFYLWTWIVVLFVRWSRDEGPDLVLVPSQPPTDDIDPTIDLIGTDEPLTYEAVQAEFDRTAPRDSAP
jgi:hypothetical protein